MEQANQHTPPEQIRVLIVDDHPLFRTGLQRALEHEAGIDVVGFCDNGPRAVEMVEELQPDVVLLDVNLPGMNGLQVARTLNSSSTEAAVVILTAHHDREQTIHAFRSGAAAYCPKDVHPDALVQLIRNVAEGYYVVNDSPMSADDFEIWLNERVEEASRGQYFTDSEGHFIPLSHREMEILEYVTQGMINKEIAHRLGISQQTVKNHMTSILKKLNVNDRTQAAVIALRRGWVRLNDSSSGED